MIVFILYLILFAALIRYNGFFNLFSDNTTTKKQFAFLFILKCLAVPVFYLVYSKFYGGIEKFDSGKFYHDVRVLNDCARSAPAEYLKTIIGLQDETIPGKTPNDCISGTFNWDNGTVKDFLYNDNRVLIRVHALLDWFTFGSYFAHALFSCFLGFIGIFFLYRTFKEFFLGKELLLLIILCFVPALWFYTGGLLKEGLAIFFMGLIAMQLKGIAAHGPRLKNAILMLPLLLISILLKPYLLFFFLCCLSLFFYTPKNQNKT